MKKIKLSEEEWKKKLSSVEFNILREKGTEPAFSGKYVEFNKKGRFVCAACGNELFPSETKFESHCGWPSFYEAKKDAVNFNDDQSHGMRRIEATCAKCGGHLGHVFDDGPQPTGLRYCINSAALQFEEEKKTETADGEHKNEQPESGASKQ